MEPTNQAAGPDAAGRDSEPDPEPDPDAEPARAERAREAPERTEEADADRGVEPPVDADDGEASAGEASANARKGAVMRTGVGGAVSPGERSTSRMSSATSKREGRDDEEAGSRVLGAITHHPRFGLQMIWARSTILASGGAGVVYRETSNPHVATGDGLAAAYRAGAQLADMAFTQFHPTVLYLPGAARSLISEAVRGEGAHLLDAAGRRFMPEVHALAELAPRDVVSRAIVKQLAQQGGQHVLLDCRHVEGFAARFPGISSLLANFDLDPRVDLIPVHPAAHYTVGGARADAACRTSVPGLLAVGEASCSGLHGANRLASNSLLEGLVLGEVAGLEAVREASGEPLSKPAKVVSDIRPSVQGELDLSDVRSSLRAAMWRNVGIERTGAKLRDAVEMFDFWGRYTLDKIFDEPEGWETQNMLLVGALMARSALWREETRGCHARDDFPATRPEFLVHDCWTRGDEGPEPVAVETGELVRTRA